MTNNPYIAPSAPPAPPENTRPSSLRRFAVVGGRYLIAYLAGILLCVLLTPASIMLVSYPIAILYPFLAVVGVPLFYLCLSGPYYPYGGEGLAFMLMYSVGFIPIAMELAVLALPRHVRGYRPIWIGTPVGFVGTLGIYYTAAASV